MKLMLDIPDGLYDNIDDIENGSIASKEVLNCVKRAKPFNPEDHINCNDMLDTVGHGTTYTSEEVQRIIKNLPSV